MSEQTFSVHGGHVRSVNVGAPRTVEWAGRQVTSGIWKDPVAGRVRVAGINLDGDDQADRRVHGGPHKAVYAYATEDLRWWSDRLGAELAPGTFGENLTVEGIDLHAALVGEIWAVGDARLRITEPRLPCFKLGIRMGDAAFVRRFEEVRRFGSYLAIDEPGTVGAGDRLELVGRPDTSLTIAGIISAYFDRDPGLVREVAEHPLVSDSWRDWALRTLERQQGKRSA